MTSIGLWGRYKGVLVLSSTLKLVMINFLCVNMTFSFLCYWEIVAFGLDFRSGKKVNLVKLD